MPTYIDFYCQFDVSQLETICRMRKLPKGSWIEMVLKLAAEDRQFEKEKVSAQQGGSEVGQLAREVAAVALGSERRETLEEDEAEGGRSSGR